MQRSLALSTALTLTESKLQCRAFRGVRRHDAGAALAMSVAPDSLAHATLLDERDGVVNEWTSGVKSATAAAFSREERLI